MEHKLEVDVHAHWSDNPPVYRLYVNDEMLTERTFGWAPHQFYIRENLSCNLNTGVHRLRLDQINNSGYLELDNLRVNTDQVNKSFLKTNENKHEWTFIIDLENKNNNASFI
jgi:hypothetical protein